MKTKLLVTLLLTVAILSFPACQEENPNLPFNVNDVKAGEQFQTSEFIDALLDGRILKMEYTTRTHQMYTDPDGNNYANVVTYQYTLVEDKFTKPGEIWLHYTDGMHIPRRYKLERCPVSGGAILYCYQPKFDVSNPDVYHWWDAEIIDWYDNQPTYVLTEKDGIVFKFRDNSRSGSKDYCLVEVYGKLSANQMFGGEWSLSDEVQPGWWQNYTSENLSDVMKRAYEVITIDAIQTGFDQSSYYWASPHEFKITRK